MKKLSLFQLLIIIALAVFLFLYATKREPNTYNEITLYKTFYYVSFPDNEGDKVILSDKYETRDAAYRKIRELNIPNLLNGKPRVKGEVIEREEKVPALLNTKTGQLIIFEPSGEKSFIDLEDAEDLIRQNLSDRIDSSKQNDNRTP